MELTTKEGSENMGKAAALAVFAAIFTMGASAVIPDTRARSVHLHHGPHAGETVTALRGSVTVTEVQTNSYYSIINCERAYCGVQDLLGHRVFIFSVWEPGDPMDLNAKESAVAAEDRAKVVYLAEDFESARFGNEGTGVKVMSDIGWKTGEVVSAWIELAPDGDSRTAFTCRIKGPGQGDWRKVATISTVGKVGSLGSAVSFVEDFWRTPASARLVRRAVFGGFEEKTAQSSGWTPLPIVKFTADSLQVDNIDAGKVDPGTFFLQTGGDTKNEHIPLWGVAN